MIVIHNRVFRQIYRWRWSSNAEDGKQHLFRRCETRFSQHKFNFNDFLAFVACQRCTMAVASIPAGLDELCTSFRDRETWLDEISDKKKNVGWGKVFTWFTICRVPCTFCLALCHFSLVLIVWWNCTWCSSEFIGAIMVHMHMQGNSIIYYSSIKLGAMIEK